MKYAGKSDDRRTRNRDTLEDELALLRYADDMQQIDTEKGSD